MNHSGTPIRVLLADDHAVVRAGIRKFLERAGDIQVVAEADDGEMALAFLQKNKPDVAVLDIQMPKMSGIEVTRWIRGNCPDIRVLILTAYNDDPYVAAILQAGANGYVLKTASPLDIIQAVRDVNKGKSALSPVIAQKLWDYISSQENGPALDPLSDREMDVLRLAAKGYTNKAVATQLGISDRTVQGHLSRIFFKLNAKTRTEAVMRAISHGWVSQDL